MVSLNELLVLKYSFLSSVLYFFLFLKFRRRFSINFGWLKTILTHYSQRVSRRAEEFVSCCIFFLLGENRKSFSFFMSPLILFRPYHTTWRLKAVPCQWQDRRRPRLMRMKCRTPPKTNSVEAFVRLSAEWGTLGSINIVLCPSLRFPFDDKQTFVAAAAAAWLMLSGGKLMVWRESS